LDIAKSVFQVHGVDAEGGVVIRQKLTRARLLKFFEKLAPCLGLRNGPSLGPRADRPGSRRPADAAELPEALCEAAEERLAEAEAICEAVARPTMRFVPVKSPEQQSVMVLHRSRPQWRFREVRAGEPIPDQAGNRRKPCGDWLERSPVARDR
jgi:transposase